MPRFWQRTKSLFAEARRRRVLRSLALYVVGSWALIQVADATFEPLGIALWVQKALIVALAVGVVPAAILAWVYDLTRHGVERTAAPGSGSLTSLAPPSADQKTPGDVNEPDPGFSGTPPMSPIAAVAILPFADLSPAADHGWFCDGLAEEIIESLCCVKGLRVASRTAAFRFRDGATDPREIGRLLAVDAILEGSLRVADGRMRVGAKLIDARAGFQEWSETYERPTSDVFAVQREIAESVARTLKLSMAATPAPAVRAAQHAPRSLEAYEAYLRGRQSLGQFQQRKLQGAPAHFRRAIELDPQYAQAWAGLADALANLAMWRFAPHADAIREGTAAASRAIDLAPDLAEAHTAQGQLRSLAGDVDGARRSFEHALELNPALFDAWHWYARHEYAHGNHARAAELFERAHRARPEDFAPLVFAAASKLKTGDVAGSQAMIRRAADGLVRQTVLEPDNARVFYLAAGALQQAGRADEAKAMALRAREIAPDDWSTLYNLACYHAAAGDVDCALDLLERAMTLGGGYPEWMANDPDLDPLRASPRYAALLARLPAGA